ncbi:bifunctional RNase H/acid phosphatase [Actinobacteria bacterium YIM 96077]|uniref:Bifunctional RNase H/acid phosphatase n=1 Tax=Phytoactinopolyspora halophila TaxID=1981511 RepID=A0A329QTH7_9ACTN|nr:bifunctional RNase H/acid phosphatase [Phytoactinopolyspora halophila]AYY13821.1 bifunctional RNase H/acid phosphatase [Actinobacteria bacterium YIM 96077]RAW15635.1 bifunctional RNase H/acid phosphatase [Phytoactinopolyspora halophila]
MTQLIVEADGGSRGNPGPAAFGAVVRSAGSGEVLAEVGETIGSATNNVAEYRGLIAGLELASAIDPQAQVEVRLDSKLVVEQMSGRWRVKHADLRPLALEAQRIFPPEHVTYTWVPRERNAHADRLLNDALDGKPVSAPAKSELPAGPETITGALWDDAVTTATGPARLPDVQPPEHVSHVDTSDEDTLATGDARSAEGDVDDAAPGARAVTPASAPEQPTTLVLVRHGRTPMTEARIFCGGDTEGPQLDDVGRAQAERAARALAAGTPVALPPGTEPVIVSSPMLRTRQTADMIAARLGVEKVTTDEQWRECEFGSWDGLTLAEITERFPDEAAQWLSSTSSRAPGGESLDDMAARVIAARDRVVERYPGQIVVIVTHSMPVRALVQLTLEAPPSAMFRLRPAPGSLTEIQHYSDGGIALGGFNLRP